MARTMYCMYKKVKTHTYNKIKFILKGLINLDNGFAYDIHKTCTYQRIPTVETMIEMSLLVHNTKSIRTFYVGYEGRGGGGDFWVLEFVEQ